MPGPVMKMQLVDKGKKRSWRWEKNEEEEEKQKKKRADGARREK